MDGERLSTTCVSFQHENDWRLAEQADLDVLEAAERRGLDEVRLVGEQNDAAAGSEDAVHLGEGAPIEAHKLAIDSLHSCGDADGAAFLHGILTGIQPY